jgi:aspartyl protease family protein
MITGGNIFLGSLAVMAAGLLTLGGDPQTAGIERDNVVLAEVPVAPPGLDDEEIIELKRISELKADARGHFVTDARIDGAKISVLVDTGATVVALSYEDAERVNLRPRSLDYDVPVMTANGTTNAARVTLRRVEIAGVEVRDVEGLVLPEGAMDGTLLGMSFLSKLRSFSVEDGVLTLNN